MNLPEAVQRHLNMLFVKGRCPAYVFVDRDGLLADWGGCCERYGLDDLDGGVPAEDQLDFLIGMLPLDGQRFCLPRLRMEGCRVVDVHLIGGDGGDWVVLLDVTEEAKRDEKVQQQSYELRLMDEKQRRMMRRLQAANENLLTVFNQLKLAVFLVNADGVVTFVSRFGREILGGEAGDFSDRRLLEVLSMPEGDAVKFAELLAAPGHSRERIRLLVKSNGRQRERWFEVDVRGDPRDSENRIVYFYDISELVDLRQVLKGRDRFQEMVGHSHAMQQVFQRIRDVARFDTTVLIDGETGTGKELAARAVHYSSARKDGPFVVVNCAGLADSLINSQLFGHKKGAFTDAVSDQEGVFEAADGGTIVLDEIGDIPMNTQTRILRALEQREIIRVGETKARKVNIRVLAATNKDLEEEVRLGNFRLDLLYRIKVARIHLPPLRERREDVPLLTDAFAREICAANGMQVPRFERDVMGALMIYRWPGNIRELRNVIEFALIDCKGGVVRLGDLPPELTAVSARRDVSGRDAEAEKERIAAALKACDGRRDPAARMLGISRATLYRKLKAYGFSA